MWRWKTFYCIIKILNFQSNYRFCATIIYQISILMISSLKLLLFFCQKQKGCKLWSILASSCSYLSFDKCHIFCSHALGRSLKTFFGLNFCFTVISWCVLQFCRMLMYNSILVLYLWVMWCSHRFERIYLDTTWGLPA
jgi:hypothetical protein